MGKNNAYLQKQQEKKTAFMNAVEHIVRQYDIDTLIITLNEDYGFGYDRLMELLDKWNDTRKKYRPAINPDCFDEADVAQEHIDQHMVRIMRGKAPLIPFEERYIALKKIRY